MKPSRRELEALKDEIREAEYAFDFQIANGGDLTGVRKRLDRARQRLEDAVSGADRHWQKRRNPSPKNWERIGWGTTAVSLVAIVVLLKWGNQ